MFEEPVGKTEKDRSRLIMVTSAAAVLVVIGLIVLVTSLRSGRSEIQMARPGSPEFESYASSVAIKIVDKRWGERLGGRYGRIIFTVENTGDRTLSGLMLRGAAVGFSDEVFKDKIVSPVPTRQDELLPQQIIEVDLYLEPIPDPSAIKDMIVELYGLKVN
jgi:hypothetical protein